MENLKKKAADNITAIKTVSKNVFEFADATALSAVSGFSIYQSLHHTSVWYKALLVAGVLIALQAAILLVRHFNKSN